MNEKVRMDYVDISYICDWLEAISEKWGKKIKLVYQLVIQLCGTLFWCAVHVTGKQRW